MKQLGNLYLNENTKNEERAIYHLENAAQLNDDWAISFLMKFFLTRNVQKAMEYLKKKNNAESSFIMGRIYLKGEGIEENIELGIKYLEESISRGSGEAAQLLGDLFLEGYKEKIEKDEPKSIQYYEKAVIRGEIDSMIKLGEIYYNKGDANRAKFYYQKASDNQSPIAQYRLSKLYGEEKKVELQYYYLVKSADLGHVESNFEVGIKLAKEKNFSESIKRFEKCGEHSNAYNQLALIYQNEKLFQNLPLSFELFKKAAKMKNSEALFNLYLLYEKGTDLVASNFRKCFKYLESSSSLGNSEAKCVLGDIYWSGKENIPKNQKSAIDYYEKSAQTNNDTALVKLATFYETGREELAKNLDLSSHYYFLSFKNNSNLVSKKQFYKLMKRREINWRTEYHIEWTCTFPKVSETQKLILLLLCLAKKRNESRCIIFPKYIFHCFIKFICHFEQSPFNINLGIFESHNYSKIQLFDFF